MEEFECQMTRKSKLLAQLFLLHQWESLKLLLTLVREAGEMSNLNQIAAVWQFGNAV